MTTRTNDESVSDRLQALTLAFLWLCLVVGMVLHFNYDISGLRYGISVELPDATGVAPWSNFVIKALFYVLPFLIGVACTAFSAPAFRAFHFVMSVLFVLANGSHVVVTVMRSTEVLGYAQVLLLVAVLIVNLHLARLAYRWWRPAT